MTTLEAINFIFVSLWSLSFLFLFSFSSLFSRRQVRGLAGYTTVTFCGVYLFCDLSRTLTNELLLGLKRIIRRGGDYFLVVI
ncbi:hypothetical protein I7I50_08007 [Histoplasma capsulatum G186AR]|uniref:Uncharacterized protein n=1 Tax=Ajellomyces capsulatus TaxID=5037 RepID=A0A8H7YKA0_AJECA|nr:hypothetical protein I7I52_08523 [Histoplasma capsulatum]QSS68558.1 hypothetical protein I7I50_08007 [Histoplasma capsulatum G186AR]